jgi:uncharacterized protein YndB with AHSA1/START domain
MKSEKLIDRIEHEVLVRAPMTRTWELLSMPAHIANWYAFDGAEVDLRPGGRIALRWKEHGEFLDQVERVNAPRELAFRFVGHTPGAMPQPGNPTLVEFTLESIRDGTRVSLVESGFLRLDNPRLLWGQMCGSTLFDHDLRVSSLGAAAILP